MILIFLRALFATTSGGVLAISAVAASASPAAVVGSVAGQQGLLLPAQGRAAESGKANKKPTVPLNTINDMFAALRACWIPPPPEQARPNMQITVQMSFKRNGELLGEPRITYETPGTPQNIRLAYRAAVDATVRRCVPLPFTEGLGNALAGRPVNVRFIDERGLKRAENVQ